jgi:hypothetical protein
MAEEQANRRRFMLASADQKAGREFRAVRQPQPLLTFGNFGNFGNVGNLKL